MYNSPNTRFRNDSIPSIATPVIYAEDFNSHSVKRRYYLTNIDGQARNAWVSTFNVHEVSHFKQHYSLRTAMHMETTANPDLAFVNLNLPVPTLKEMEFAIGKIDTLKEDPG